MTISIAMAGKGGTGKTSIAGLIIRYLLKHNLTPVLAVDADPSANLGLGIGLDFELTVGSVLAGFNEDKISIPSGMTKESFLDFKLNETIVESRDIDLITMGRSEGAGCYCFPNNVLKHFIDRLMPNYQYLVMDNEAGLEHLSRGTTGQVDHLILVSNHSIKGVRTLGGILNLIAEMGLAIRHKWVVINQAPGEFAPEVSKELDRLGLKIDAVIHQNADIMEYDWHQKSLLDLPDDSAAAAFIEPLMAKIISLDQERSE